MIWLDGSLLVALLIAGDVAYRKFTARRNFREAMEYTDYKYGE
jgi:hypothetical protein